MSMTYSALTTSEENKEAPTTATQAGATTPPPRAARPASRLKQARARGSRRSYPIVVHCHLQWDWVWQRPQQFMSRLSKRHPILYVETLPPTPELEEPKASIREVPGTGVTLLQIQFPLGCWSNGHFVDRERRRLVQAAIAGPLGGRFEYPVQWFYDPMAVTAFAGHLDERAVVYDCMDELSKFKHAPPEIIERERVLLSLADVVFTGGRRMWEAKRTQNANCHFYGCGVDVDHFAQARTDALPVGPELREMSHPILGYFGVVDERLDYGLLRRMAEVHPEWNIVMVGPSTKVDPATLPQAPNLHWLGGRPYAELPAYAKAFDVCLMPFALNEATEYINPTKALEYMATGRPIVSSAVPDVVSNFSEVVLVAESPEDFIRKCAECLQGGAPLAQRQAKGLAMAQDNTWESVVAHLEQHVAAALVQKQGRTFSHAAQINLNPRGGKINLPLPVVG